MTRNNPENDPEKSWKKIPTVFENSKNVMNQISSRKVEKCKNSEKSGKIEKKNKKWNDKKKRQEMTEKWKIKTDNYEKESNSNELEKKKDKMAETMSVGNPRQHQHGSGRFSKTNPIQSNLMKSNEMEHGERKKK